MTITEAQKELDELQAKIAANYKDNDFDGFSRCCGRRERKPLQERADKLMLAIIKANWITQIQI